MTGTILKRYLSIGLVLALVAAPGGGCTKAARRSRYLARADRDFRAERYDRAEIEYLAVFRVAPMDPAAVSKLGLLYFTEGRMPQACEFLKKAVEFHPNEVELRTKLALADFSLHGIKEARQEALQVLNKQPGNPDALLLLADTTATTNQLKESLQKLDALPPAVKGQVAYHIARGTLWLRQQNLTNAETEFKRAAAQDPKSSIAYSALGNFYVLRNDLKQAEMCLKTAAELAPLRSTARIRYADFRLKTGAADEAKKAVTEITQNAPDYIPAWIFLARAAFAERKADGCSALIQKVLERDPINRDALLMKGDLMLAKGDGTNALARFERVAAVYGRDPEVLYKLALANLLNRDITKAVANLNQAVAAQPDYANAVMLLANLNIRKGDPGQAVIWLTQLTKRQPQLLQAHLLLANAYLAQRDPDSAVAVYRRMLTLFPSSPQVPVLLGSLLALQNKQAEARRAFEQSLTLSPGYLPAVEALATLDILEKNYSAALDRAHKLLDRNSKAPEPWVLLAKIHIAKARGCVDDANKKITDPAQRKLRLADVPAVQADLNQAETELLKAVELKPELAASYLLLSELYVASGKPQQALDQLNNLLARTNDITALVEVGMMRQTAKNYAAARDAYEKALTLDPNFSLALNNLAYLYSERLPDLEKAWRLAEKARQLQPRDASTADTLGWILYQRGEYPRALGLIEEAVAALPDSAEIQLHLGMAHYALAEEAPARAALERAMRAGDDFPGKPDGQRRLAILAINPKTANQASIALLEDQVKRAPGDSIALGRLAAIQERDGALDKTLDTYQTLLKHNPQNTLAMMHLAQLYSSSRFYDLQKALEMAKQAHGLAPDDASVSALLGRLAFQTEDYRWAASLLEESARKLPKDSEVSYDLAWAYYGLGRVAEAEAAMQTAAGTLFARREEAKRFLAMLTATKGPAISEQAAAQAESILKADPNYAPALMVSGMDQEARGDSKQAAQRYGKVLARFPLFAPATRNLAVLYFERLGDDTKAYELANKARQAFPQDPGIAKTLGILIYRKGDYTRAAELLKQTAQQRQSDGEALYYLGMAQYQLKANAECKATLQRALALNIQPKLAGDAKRVLAEVKSESH